MKNNTILTGVERQVDPSKTIVSMTDMQGNIVDCNDAFVEISGYMRHELIGQPHNILRHPDVPKAVFKDLWKTLKKGKPWVQLVKNRCKNGDHYWVEANVTPVLENGQIVGYKSVRRPINEQQKQAAQSAYEAINAKKLSIKEGYIPSFFDRICTFNHIHPMSVMIFLIILLSVMTVLESSGAVHLPVWLDIVVAIWALLLAVVGRNYMVNRMNRVSEMLDEIRNGDFTGQINTFGGTSLSKVTSAVKMMQIQVGADHEATLFKLNENTRLKVALDNANTNMMVVDQFNHVIYLNKSLKRFLKSVEDRIRLVCPGFELENIIGQDAAIFAADKGYPQNLMKEIQQETKLELKIGDLIIQFNIQPVFNEENVRIGSVIEWLDLTQQRNIELTLEEALKLASKGHTDLSLNAKGLDGFYGRVAADINLLLSTLNSAMEDMVKVMVNLASGDLTGRIDKDLSGSLAAMQTATNVSLDNLGAIMMHIKEVSQVAANSSRESSQAAHDLSERTQQAAATLEEINATMHGVNQLQEENSASLQNVSATTRHTMEENERASKVMLSSVEAMESIRQTSEKIADIIGIIDSIAFQTNLLALNAAVEAARAGEHGRGFAVVAGEVRSLAGKSAEAANEIKALIEEAGEKVNKGSTTVKETHAVFQEVNEGVQKIGITLEEVMTSIDSQRNSVNEVSAAIHVLDENIQNNAALVEETSASAESLASQADQLDFEVQKFKINEQAAKAQKFPEVHGVRMADVRQKMRIWRATMQSYIAGMEVPVNLDTAIDPKLCGVGQALSKLFIADPSIEQLDAMRKVNSLHVKQHNLVKVMLDCRDAHNLPEDFNTIELQDQMVEDFIQVTNNLDDALGELEEAIFLHTDKNALLPVSNKY